ncbi:MAG TPA: alpha/beta hydrolase [Capillimicrobium sp.]|nr:alpha/beta hydrolase [Capillimicrobium sp.]
MSAPRRTRLTAGGTSTRLVEAGPADRSEAVVFVHGNPGSADDWVGLVQAAGTVTRAVAVDLPDFGETVAPDGFDHRPETYARWLGSALEALGIERAHLVLHDFGGPIGLMWAGANPQRLASLTLIDTGILPGYRWHRLARIWRTPVVGEIFQAITTPRQLARGIAREEPRGLPQPFLDTMASHWDRRTKRAVLRLYRATPDPGRGPAGGMPVSADLPVLVIWGEGDVYLPSSYAGRQREAFPKAQVHVLAGSGHWPFADAPEEVERLLLDFLRTVAS